MSTFNQFFPQVVNDENFVLVTESMAVEHGITYRIVSDTPVTLTLPSNPTNGTEIRIEDGESITDDNHHIIARNGKTIMGDTDNLTLDVTGLMFTIWYDSSSDDWRLF